jgi:hypothetical protein
MQKSELDMIRPPQHRSAFDFESEFYAILFGYVPNYNRSFVISQQHMYESHLVLAQQQYCEELEPSTVLLVLFQPRELSGRAETGRTRRSDKTLCGKTRKAHSVADLYPAPTLGEIPLIPSAEWLGGGFFRN